MTLWLRTAPFVINNLRRNHYKLLGIQRTDDQKGIGRIIFTRITIFVIFERPEDVRVQYGKLGYSNI